MLQGTNAAGRRRISAAVAVLGVLTLVVAFFAVRYDGVKASAVRVNDGTVWVLNQSRGLMVRMNVDEARACGDDVVSQAVAEADPDADLSLRVNRDLVVLNDQELGLSWMVADQMQIVNEWQITEKEKTPPSAQPDRFGVRPGAKAVLPVLRHDTDPDGDDLTASVRGEQPRIGQVSEITGGTQLQIDVAEDAGTLAIEAVDGADLAPVTTSDHVSVPVGQTATVRPLNNDINPQGGALRIRGGRR